MTTSDGDSRVYPLTSKTPHIEGMLVRVKKTNDLYLPITSTLDFKRKQEKLYVLLDFEDDLTMDFLVDSRAYVSAFAQNDLNTKNQKAPKNIFKIYDPPNYQKQVANGQLEKPSGTMTRKFDTGDNTFTEPFVLLEKLTGPNIGLHFRKNNSSVIGTTQSLIHIPHLTMQVKATSEMSAKSQAVLTDNAVTISLRTTKTIIAFVD